MADDIFGDDDLFAEFDRDREQRNIFINYEKDESGIENRSRIIFKDAESDYDESDEEKVSTPSCAPEDEEDQDDGGGAPAPGPAQNGHAKDKDGTSEEEMNVDAAKTDDIKEAVTDSQDAVTEDQSCQPTTTSHKEQFEKNKLRTFAKLIDSTRYVCDEQSPGVQIIYHNNRFAKKYRGKIEQFLIGLMHHGEKKDFCKPALDFTSQQQNVITCVDINNQIPAEKRSKKMWQLHGVIGCAQFHHLFMVDSKGWIHEAGESLEASSEELPKYHQVFEQVFPVDESALVDDSKPAKSKSSCFNCGGDHRLNECKAPKDQERIRSKRREQQDKSSAKSSNPGRYHEDPELDPTQMKFQAGQISDSLREAIGLKPDQLPSYIYRMRSFGYPPGWLMEANRKPLSLAMYDKDGRETNIRGESLEDGECGDPSNGKELFDINKIIEYPGFTIPVPEGFIDESDAIGMPPIQQHQLKKTLMEDTTAKDKSKKRRTEEEEAEKSKKLKPQPEHFDFLDEEVSTIADQEPEKMGEEPIAASIQMVGAELEAERLEEGAEINKEKQAMENGEIKEEGNKASITGDQENMDGTGINCPTEPGASKMEPDTSEDVEMLLSDPDTTAASTTAVNGSALDTPGTPTGQTPTTEFESGRLQEVNFTFTHSGSISRDYGTPILVRERSFQQLPATHNFQQGIEDHIPYENLPDAVGTFERMRNLFSEIRQKVRKAKK